MSSATTGGPIGRGRGGRLREELRQPLFRNGHALVLSSFATATIGFAYWVLAARGYAPQIVGRSSVALTTLSFVGGISQCNLASALVRFIPGAGRSLRRFVLASYGFSFVVSVVLAAVFFVALPSIAPSLEFLRQDRTIEVWFVVATASQAIFVLEDGVLTGLRRAPLVPLENAAFSTLKAVLVIAIAGLRPQTGIFLSWTIATVATIVPTNIYIFARALPSHVRDHPEGHVSLRDLVRYVPSDYGAWLFWASATSLLPLIVIASAGATAAATFNFAWVITYSLYLVSINLGSSLVVESASDQSDLAAKCRQVMTHLAKLVVPASVAIAVAAPVIMRIFGHNYASSGASTLRLLALSAPPFVVTSTLQSALRALRRTTAVLAIDATLCTSAIALSWVLLPHLGIVSTGIGWCVAQYGVALALGAVVLARGRSDSRTLLTSVLGGRSSPRVEVPERPSARFETSFAESALAQADGVLAARPSATPDPDLAGRRAQLLDEVAPLLASSLDELRPGAGSADAVEVEAVQGAGAATGCVAILCRQGWPVALAEVSANDREAAALRRRTAALEVLAGCEALGEWRELLPSGITASAGVRVYRVELLSGGIDAASVLEAAPLLWKAVAKRGVETLGTLHGATGATGAFGDVAPLDELARATCERLRRRLRAGGSRPAGLLSRIGDLEERLVAAARGSAGEPRAFTHGELSPALLRVSPEAAMVTGLRGFERGRPDGVPAIDSLGFVLRLCAHVRRCSLAEVVAEVAAGGALVGELDALLPAILEQSGIGLADLSLWCWADEVAARWSAAEAADAHLGEIVPVLASLERAS